MTSPNSFANKLLNADPRTRPLQPWDGATAGKVLPFPDLPGDLPPFAPLEACEEAARRDYTSPTHEDLADGMAPSAFSATPWRKIDPAAVPRVLFVYGSDFARGYVSATYAAPKTGKSALAIAEAVDAATGRGFLTGSAAEPRRVLYVNLEDDLATLQSRVLAVLKAWQIPQDDIVDRLTVWSGIDRALHLIRDVKGKGAINEEAFAALSKWIAEHRIDLALFDPLQDLSSADESNESFRALGGRLRRLAVETDCAIGIVHHTRKMAAGVAPTLDDARGGSALRGIARFNRLLVPMTESEGGRSGVDDHRHFFRVAEAESNLAPPSSARNTWFEKVGQVIGNGATIVTLRPWAWPDAFAGLGAADLARVQNAIHARAANPPRRHVTSKDWAGHVIGAVLGIDTAEKAGKARVKALLKEWLRTGALIEEKRPDGRAGRDVPVIRCGRLD